MNLLFPTIIWITLTIPILAHASIENTFLQSKKDPQKLYAFLKAMPKGGELHYHLSGGAYPERMLELAAKDNYCLDTNSFVITKNPSFCGGISSSDLMKNPSLYKKTMEAWSMENFNPEIASGHDHFFESFYKFNSIVENNRVPLLASVMHRAASQHVQYMEIMIKPDNLQTVMPLQEKDIPKDYKKFQKVLLANPIFQKEVHKTIKIAENLLPEARKYLGCDKDPRQEVCHLTVRFQYHALREQAWYRVFQEALLGFVAASKSKAIVGVNLVQAEDGPISLRDYRKQMGIFDFLHHRYPRVSISLHAGELPLTGLAAKDYRSHIHDAIRYGHANRIGHGVAIRLEDNADNVLAKMAKEGIPVEINLTSNFKILNVRGEKHPILYYLKHKVLLVLSTDDEGILRTDLTQQYMEAVNLYGLDYAQIKQINRNALTYSFLPGKSIWQNPEKAMMVKACEDLNSKACQLFVKSSEKARIQRQLEQKLAVFESFN